MSAGFDLRPPEPAPLAGPTEAGQRADLYRLGLWLGVIALSMVFLAVIGAFIVQRFGTAVWPPEGVRLNLPLGLVNTAVIVASSLALEAARRRARDGNREGARTSLQLCGGLALGFLGLQAYQYSSLIRSFGQSIQSSQFGTYFYSLTGLHAVHLLAGVLWLVILMARRAALSALQVELCGRYWHFVTFLWAILFALLYLV